MISFLFLKNAIALIPFALFCHCFIDLSIIELFQLADTRQRKLVIVSLGLIIWK